MNQFNYLIVSIALGTTISVLVAYIVTFRNDLFNKFFYDSFKELSLFNKNFDDLIRKNMFKYFRMNKSRPTQKSSKMQRKSTTIHQHDDSLIINILAEQLATLNTSKKNKNELENIQELILAISNRDKKIFKNYSTSYKNLTKVKISEQLFLEVSLKLLWGNHFIKDIKKKEILKLTEAKDLIFAALTLSLMLDDIKLNDLSICNNIAGRFKLDKFTIFKAVNATFALKRGASEKSIIDKMAKLKTTQHFFLYHYDEEKKFQLIIDLLRNKDLSYHHFQYMLTQIGEMGLKIKLRIDQLLQDEAKAKSKKREQNNQQKNQSQNKQQQESASPKSFIHSSKMKNAYGMLEIDPTMNIAFVKKSYKKQAMKKHPDKRMSTNTSDREARQIHDEFIQVQNAYNYLIKMLAS